MTLEEHYEIERTEGREEERIRIVKNSLKYGNSIEQTALILGLSVEEVQRLSKVQPLE